MADYINSYGYKQKMTWWRAIDAVLTGWRTLNWMRTQDWSKSTYQVLNWKEYCANGMSHERR